jgi:hypothetical protein
MSKMVLSFFPLQRSVPNNLSVSFVRYLLI